MTDLELRKFVRSLRSSIAYCAPEALESLLYDKLKLVIEDDGQIDRLRAELAAASAEIAELREENEELSEKRPDGGVWKCENCRKWVSGAEGTDNERPNWCDSCWMIERLQTELAAAKSAILFMPPADIPNTYMAQVDMRSRCYSRLSAIGTANDAPADVAHQWQPVEDETDIDCSCDDPECTSEVQVDGSYLLAFCEGAFVQMDLGEYRICRKVQHA